VGSFAVMHLISMRDYPSKPAPATLPWAVVLVLLAAAAIWVLFQPMEMRGMALTG
jgi:hypothetical protein